MTECPKCQNADDGQFVMLEDPTVYDGWLVMQCALCGHAQPRVFPGMTHRNVKAREWADQINDRSNQH